MKTSYVYQLVNLLSSLALLFLVLARLDPGIYLQWVLFQTITGALIQIEQSLNTVSTRALSMALATEKASAFLSALGRVRKAYRTLAVGGGLLMFLVGAAYLGHVDDGRFGSRWLLEWVIYCAAFALYYSATHYACALVALDRAKRFSEIAMSVRIFNLAISAGLLVAGFGVLGLSVSALLSFAVGAALFRLAGAAAAHEQLAGMDATTAVSNSEVHLASRHVLLQLLFVAASYGLYRAGLIVAAASQLATDVQAGFALALQIFLLMTTVATVPLAMRVTPLVEAVSRGDKRETLRELGLLAAYVNIVFVAATTALVLLAPVVREILPGRGASLPSAETLSLLGFAFWIEVNIVVLANALIAARRFDFARRYATSVLTGLSLACVAWACGVGFIVSFVVVPAACQIVLALRMLLKMLKAVHGIAAADFVRATLGHAARIIRHPITVGLRFGY